MSRSTAHHREDRLSAERRSAGRRSISAAGIVLAAAAMCSAAARAEPQKRDLRGFSLGMGKDQAARHASGQCRNFGTVSFQGGTYGETFFESVRDYGKQFVCSYSDDSVISYSLTPRTRKIYKLEGSFLSQLNCDELLAFVKETFAIGGDYTRYSPKPAATADRCAGWAWQFAPGYELKVWLDDTEAARFHVALTDAEIVKENESSAEDARKRIAAKPRL